MRSWYFDNSRRKQLESKMGSYDSRTKDLLRQLGEHFTLDEFIKVGEYDRKTAQSVLYALKKRNLVKPMSTKRGNEKWQKILVS
jgi:hypothetical protein